MTTVQKLSPSVRRPLSLQPTQWWSHWVWLVGIALVSMLIPAFFVGLLRLPRNVYLMPYVLFVLTALYRYVRWAEVDLRERLRQHWRRGVGVGLLFSIYTVQTVLIQPRSPTPQGAILVFDLAWLGVVYGAMDGLLLSVLPVYAIWQSCTLLGWTTRWPGRLGSALLAVLASMIVIGAYHIGYPEFRGPQVVVVMVGVGIQSVGYLITGSALAPVISHVTMHLAAVLYGIQSVSQLPPHY